ncbi:OLC1v1025848C1 [Oldenlandia corymbosa var. corymbosa]|uniref:RING-type E3 ubiquitin transferase n=1 Tax=Oldenlandia corymbosa var. corymbosa TaxID=529605 RepID=A0AAV1C675_OLDCO|nr:OLC1v1025848C1 [Oldenlandia corymbosa var. corymbosa]
MAKPTTPDKGVPETKTTASDVELKTELRKAVQSIVEGEDYALEDTDRAMQSLSSLKRFLSMRSSPESVSVDLPPPEFVCPISGKLMSDPVVIASGQTYDRPSIQEWFADGNLTCPQTEEVLSHTSLIPNLLLKGLIVRWCKENGADLPTSLLDVEGDTATANVGHAHLSSVLDRLSSLSVSDRAMAAKEIRQLTKKSPDFRALFGEVTDAIPRLVEPLSSGIAENDPDLLEDLITALLNISIHGDNKKLLAENSAVIPLMIKALRIGTVATRSNAAAALFSLASLDSNKQKIGELGALKPLIELVEEGHPQAMKDAATAIFSLCLTRENKSLAVDNGAVVILMNKIREHVLMDELLSILALLSTIQQAIDEMAELGAVPLLLEIIKESKNERNKENCVVILHTICYNHRQKLREVKREEDANRTISELAKSGTSRAKRKANGILDRLDRFFACASSSNTA